MAHPLVVGVAGGSGSGKTTVVRRIMEALGETDAVVLELREGRPVWASMTSQESCNNGNDGNRRLWSRRSRSFPSLQNSLDHVQRHINPDHFPAGLVGRRRVLDGLSVAKDEAIGRRERLVARQSHALRVLRLVGRIAQQL